MLMMMIMVMQSYDSGDVMMMEMCDDNVKVLIVTSSVEHVSFIGL